MVNLVAQSTQVLNSIDQIRKKNPDWSEEQVRDYFRFKNDVLNIAEQTDSSSGNIEDLEDRVAQNENDIQINRNDIDNNAQRITDNEQNILTNAQNIQQNADNFSDHINQGVTPDPHPQYKMKLGGWSLFGTVSNFTFDTTPSKLINYSDSDNWDGGSATPIDAANGELTIPETGLYRIVALLIGEQGNTTKEESMIFQIDVNSTKFTVDVFDVATDKTDLRSFNSVFTRRLSQNDVVSLFAVATANMGTFTVESSTFELQRLE